MGYRMVKMTTELFEEFFTEGWTCPSEDNTRIRCIKGLPAGAKLEAVSMDLWFDSGAVALKFSHPSWDNQPTDAIPVISVTYSRELIDIPHYVGGES